MVQVISLAGLCRSHFKKSPLHLKSSSTAPPTWSINYTRILLIREIVLFPITPDCASRILTSRRHLRLEEFLDFNTQFTMYNSITSSYLLPAIFLNPVLFLHSLNTILSRILPPIHVLGAAQQPPFSTLGPSAFSPHIDVHSSDRFCWSYTIVMVCAQLVAFGRISQCREEGRRRMKLKEMVLAGSRPALNGDSRHITGARELPNGDGIHMNGVEYFKKSSGASEESYFG